MRLEQMVEMRSYKGEGYQTLITYDSWRVAVLNYLDELHPANITSMERHLQTDEVFMLVKGEGVLILGGNGPQIEELIACQMEPGSVYNIRFNTWHTILMSKDASVLIVENDNTCDANSEKTLLGGGIRKQLLMLANHHGL